MYLALDRFDKALEDYEEAIVINPHPTYLQRKLQRKLDMLLRYGDDNGAAVVRELMNQMSDGNK
jgi:tetratricopeptide (TPR) repeat protein